MPSNAEPTLRDPDRAFRYVFGLHGPLRYEPGAGDFNGACSRIEPSDAFVKAGGINAGLNGPGAVWGWYVGSPRAFIFGFVRSSAWATRKMRLHLMDEFEASKSEPLA